MDDASRRTTRCTATSSRPRTGARHASISPYGPYRVGDGHVFLGIQNDREWARFCHDVIATPELVDDPRFRHNNDRVAHDGELTVIIEGALRATPVAAAVPLLESAGIACARLRTPREFFDHPQLAARDRWRTIEAPGGPVRSLVPPVTVAGREVRLGGVPRLGQDNDAIRQEFAPGPGRRPGVDDVTGSGPAPAIDRTEVLSTAPAAALASLLDVAPVDTEGGEGLPLGWHWLYLLDRPAQADLGEDGHPLRGTVPAPPGPGRRRMWAGGEVVTTGRLRLGESASRRSLVVATEEKNGRAGPFTLVTVLHEISQGGAVRVRERQDIVYRAALPPGAGDGAPSDAAPTGSAPTEPPTEPETEPDTAQLRVDTRATLLFRFSALTYNAHRIHYDREYARDVEGYPGLVVHGPLQALVMAEVARSLPWATGDSMTYRYRLVAPLFEGQGLVAGAAPTGTGLATQVRDDAGRVTARGELRRGTT